MFLYPEFISQNSLKDVRPGHYHGVCSVYVERKSHARALLSEYWLSTENSSSLAELQMIDSTGQTVRFLDFMRMPDGSWRDSYGMRADSLGKLLPVHLTFYSLFEQVQTGTQVVENNDE